MAGMPKNTPALRRFTTGQTVLFGGAIVLASFGGFYLNIRRIHNKKAAEGTLPHYEYLLAHVASDEPGAGDPPMTRVERRKTPVPTPQKEHRNGHSTIPDSKESAAGGGGGSRVGLEQPMPQRAKEIGSSVAYTKSPDYVKSYEKHVAGKPGGEEAAGAGTM